MYKTGLCAVRVVTFFGANGRERNVLENNISTSIAIIKGSSDTILSVHAFDRDNLKTVRTKDNPDKKRGYTHQLCADVTCNRTYHN